MTGSALVLPDEWRVEQGDALEVMRRIPDGTVSTLITSPPYFSLRSYLPAEHPEKAKEMGSEQSPGAFLDALLDVLDEAYRVLAPWGSLFVNIGDTYLGSGGSGGDYNEGGLREGQARAEGSGRKELNARKDSRGKGIVHGGLAKSLAMIPQALGFALVYGRNPFTGTEHHQWRVRNWNVWVKRNPTVGQIIDKWRPASEPVIFAVKERKQFFDLEAIRRPVQRQALGQRTPRMNGGAPRPRAVHDEANAGGAPPLDWWDVVPVQLPEAHFAAFPPALIEDPIKATCPARVCRECGKPSERIVETTGYCDDNGNDKENSATRQTRTIGWTDCHHDAYEPGLVLDPFCGSGTTGIVSRRLGRGFLGIELSEEYVEMSRRRIERALLPEPIRSKPKARPGQQSLEDAI